MNVFDQIEMKKSTFTKAEKKVYDAISKDYVIIFHHSSNELSKKLKVSQSSITRFCQKVGFEGYNEFSYAIYEAIHSQPSNDKLATVADYTKKIIDIIAHQAEKGEYDNFVQKLKHAPITITTGTHRSGLPARLLVIELNLLNKFAKFVPNDEVNGYFEIGNKSVVVCCSETGDSFRTGIDKIRNISDNKRPYTVLICTNNKHPLRNYFDEVIWLPNTTNQNFPVRVEPVLIYSFFIDTVVSLLAKEMKKELE